RNAPGAATRPGRTAGARPFSGVSGVASSTTPTGWRRTTLPGEQARRAWAAVNRPGF
ncbi:hypothetical protein YIM730264_19920, partial [Thermus hydrothermalis]